VPPLIVPNQYGSNENLMPKNSLALSELDSHEHYFGQSGLNIKDIAAIIGCQTFEKAEVVDQWRTIGAWKRLKGEIIGFLFVLDNITTSVEMTSYTSSLKNCTNYVTSMLSTNLLSATFVCKYFFLFIKLLPSLITCI